jgi:hypothetical protein
MTASAGQRSKGVPLYAEASDRFVLLRSRIRDCYGGPATLPAPKSKIGGGGRNARGNQFALTRVFWKYPPAIPFRESPAATGSAAIIRQAQERSRFAEDTFLQFVAAGNIKRRGACAETVEEETSLWMSEEN